MTVLLIFQQSPEADEYLPGRQRSQTPEFAAPAEKGTFTEGRNANCDMELGCRVLLTTDNFLQRECSIRACFGPTWGSRA